MADEIALLRELIEEYSDIFALNSMELGTKLNYRVGHPLN